MDDEKSGVTRANAMHSWPLKWYRSYFYESFEGNKCRETALQVNYNLKYSTQNMEEWFPSSFQELFSKAVIVNLVDKEDLKGFTCWGIQIIFSVFI